MVDAKRQGELYGVQQRADDRKRRHNQLVEEGMRIPEKPIPVKMPSGEKVDLADQTRFPGVHSNAWAAKMASYVPAPDKIMRLEIREDGVFVVDEDGNESPASETWESKYTADTLKRLRHRVEQLSQPPGTPPIIDVGPSFSGRPGKK